ncbi:hypothetical protein ACW9H6_11120 [Pseudomonas sp. SDO528_S397]
MSRIAFPRPGITRHLLLGGCVALTAGCSAVHTPDSFVLTADLPPNFAYAARADYVPAKGETCTVPGGRNTQIGFNIVDWRTDYQPDSRIALRRTVSGCPLVLHRIGLKIYGKYGKDRGDFGNGFALLVVRPTLADHHKGAFDLAGDSDVHGTCQWLFRTSGGLRRLVKILDCKATDAQGNVKRGLPFAAYTLDQLPGKTVRLKFTLADEERPFMRDTWIKVPGGWKRCMGEGFEDQDAFCRGNHKDFSTFRMPDGQHTCTIYPGCTESLEANP